MTDYEFGDILLLNAYPFSDLSGAKKRPALVIADTGNQDIMVARVTSEEVRDDHDVTLVQWKDYGLLFPSTVRISKTATLSKRLVIKKIGKIGSPERRKVRTALRQFLGL